MNKANQRKIGELIGQVFGDYQITEKLRETRLKRDWPEIMGPAIAKYTDRIVLRKGRLSLYLSSAPLRQELTFAKDKLRERLNDALEEECIEEIQIR